jgi:hypothetical protein
MTKRGPKSSAELAVVALAGRYPAILPPRKLAADVAAVWKRVNRVPAGWFQPEQVDVLLGYCEATAASQRARNALRDPEIDLREYALLSAIAARESALALAYARALRLTVQSRVQAISAGRRANGARPTPSVDALFEHE